LETFTFCVSAVFIKTDQIQPLALKDYTGNKIRGYLCSLPMLGGAQ